MAFENVPKSTNKKILKKPVNVLHELELHFSLHDKYNVLTCMSHPFIYNFFSFRDSLVFIAKDRHKTYSVRGYLPSGFHLGYDVLESCAPLYDIFYCHSDFRCCRMEFQRIVRELFDFYYCNPSYNELLSRSPIL